jgi:glucokinase
LPDSVKRFKNAQYPSLFDVVADYIGGTDITKSDITGACVAGAGPVRDGVVTLTNLHWQIGENQLAEEFNTKNVSVLNDLQAQGYAIDAVSDADMQAILPHPETSGGSTKLVIGIGTGFNACPVFQANGGRFVPPSEAGHVSLPAHDHKGIDLIQDLTRKHGFASVEEILSGRGIAYLHHHLHGVFHDTPDVMELINQGDEKAMQTGRIYVSVMGAVVGDLALNHLPFGGIYLVGGVVRAFAPHLHSLGFREEFRRKGRFSTYMDQFGIHVVTDDYAALTGCAAFLAAG